MSSPERQVEHCAAHGGYEPRRIMANYTTGCPECTRLQREAEEAERRRTMRNDSAAALRRERIESSGLRGRYLTADFAAFHAASDGQVRAKAACEKFAASILAREWAALTLIGPPGTGKTHLLSAMALRVIDAGGRAKILAGGALGRALRSTWAKEARTTERDLLASWTGVDLLCIDEVGMVGLTEFEQRALFEVVDARYAEGRPIAVATNANLPEMREAVGDRIFDRLREAGLAVACDWPSHRGLKA